MLHRRSELADRQVTSLTGLLVILSAGEKRGGVQLLYLMVIMMGEFFWLYKCVSWQLILLASPSHWSLFVLVYWTSVNRQTTKHPNYPLGSGREIHIRWPCFRRWDNIADLLNKEILGNKLSDLNLWIVQTLCVCLCVSEWWYKNNPVSRNPCFLSMISSV